jgi:alpha-beta hydrolase superfamily lysophospholipase
MSTVSATALASWDTGTDLRGYSCAPDAPVASVLVVHGYGEHAGRHAKTMARWAARGLACYAYDQRGHGNSPGKRGTFERFDDLVDDTLALRARVAAEQAGLPAFVFGMSMGGLVATRAAQRRSEGLRGLVLCSPAFAVAEDIPGFVRGMLRGVRSFAPGLQLKKLPVDKLSIDQEVGRVYVADPLNYHGGVPLCSAITFADAGDAAIADAPPFRVPTLLFSGTEDKLVFPIGSERFAKADAANPDLTYTVIAGGYHELFNDPGGEKLVDQAADWMLARL